MPSAQNLQASSRTMAKGDTTQGASCCASPNVGSTERMYSTGLGGLLVAAGIARGRLPGLLMMAAGGSLLWRGLSGHCAMYQYLNMDTREHDGELKPVKGIKVEQSLRINRPAHELYDRWTQWEKLPEILPHIEQIEVLEEGRMRWTARGPLGTPLSWEAQIINQRADRFVAWQSLTGGDVDTAGSVHFNPISSEATDMHVSMQYDPPGGKWTASLGEFLGIGLKKRLSEDLRQFKETMESKSAEPTNG